MYRLTSQLRHALPLFNMVKAFLCASLRPLRRASQHNRVSPSILEQGRVVPNPMTTSRPQNFSICQLNMKTLATGGGSGIGWMITQALVSNGAKVYIIGRDIDGLQTVVDKHSTALGKIIAYVQQLPCTKFKTDMPILVSHRHFISAFQFSLS